MTQITRERWLGVLEIVAIRQPDQAAAEWKWLMGELGLGAQYFVAIYEAIKEGRWRTAGDPAAYIKTVAKRQKSVERREKERLGLLSKPREQLARVNGAEVDGELISGEEMLDNLEQQHDRGEPTKAADGVWRSAAGWERYDGGRLRKPGKLKPETPAKSKALESFKRRAREIQEARQAENSQYFHVDQKPERLPDWQQWAETAGLSEWEKRVAVYKVSGIGREQALREQPDEESRKALQAAWKKFERTALERLRAVAPKEEEEEI